jgi:hypothetical protein
MPDIIVLLPGILGSVLRKDGRDVWAPSGDALLGGLLSGGNSIRALTLAEDDAQEDLEDGVTADRLMPDIHLLPTLWKIDGYTKIRQTIGTVFNVTEGQNYFEFPYDWRRDNRVAASKLQRNSHEWLKEWRERSGNHEAKLILIAHSMGGLVARYYLEILEGWRDTRALITFGTPYRGSFNALDALANGVRKGPFGLLDFSEFARSLTSIYQLLPIYESYNQGDGRLVRIGETQGIPNVEAAKAAAALDFHHEIEAKVDEHLQRPDYKEGYETFSVVGIRQPTFQSARGDRDGVVLLNTRRDEDPKGDGTVPRPSATPLELSDDPGNMYSATRHASLQNAQAVLEHLAGVITNLYLDLGAYRAPTSIRARLSLHIEDAYWPNEPVKLRVQPDRGGLELNAAITEARTGREVSRQPLRPSVEEGWQEAEFAPLAGGAYRVAVSGNAAVEPAEDVFAVFEVSEEDYGNR